MAVTVTVTVWFAPHPHRQLKLEEDASGSRYLIVTSSDLRHTCSLEANLTGHRRPGLSKQAVLHTGLPTAAAFGLKKGSIGSIMTSAVTSMTGLRTSEQTGRAAVRTAEQIARGDPYDFRLCLHCNL
jgi:hypothetical protein